MICIHKNNFPKIIILKFEARKTRQKVNLFDSTKLIRYQGTNGVLNTRRSSNGTQDIVTLNKV
jgi:hypothetical protein